VKKLKLGIVGACGRGSSFKLAVQASGEAEVFAVCDTHEQGLEAARLRLGATEKYADYADMLDHAELDGVIVATPMPLHVPQSIAALDRGVSVLCEVPAGVSVDECRELTQAVRRAESRTRATYMMAENYTYLRSNVLIREMVRRGLFGETHFAEAEYIHELKGLNEITTWRRRWQTGINGNTYPTHSLGPVLQWMPGQRVNRVACAGSGRRFTDPRGDPYEQEASTLTLCATDKGGLIKLRLDMLSDRPHAMTNYQLQGIDGCYESSRAHGDRDRVWIRGRCAEGQWKDLSEFESEFLPDMWRSASETAKSAGHGGGDYFEVIDFIDAVRGRRPPEIGIDAAMDMTLPGLCSQISIAQGGRWVDVPDSRAWTSDYVHRDGQLFMRWPDAVPAPDVRLPAEYRLRAFSPADTAAYGSLMEKAGFGTWSDDRIRGTFHRTLDDGMLLVEHTPTRTVVATALANPAPADRYPHGGELGWVAADPAHAGKGLGRAVCSAVVALYLSRGYRTIYLSTDDWRLPAIAVYLAMGFVPDEFKPDMPQRWAEVRSALRK